MQPPSEAFATAMMRAAAPETEADVTTPSPPFARVAELLSIGGGGATDADPAVRIVDLTLAVARLQAFAAQVHENLLEVERRALAAGTNNSRASKALTDANSAHAVIARRRAVSAMCIAGSMLVSAVRSVGGSVTPKLLAPMTSGEEDCNAVIAHATASEAPLFDYLADETTPAWIRYESLFGKSEASAADTSIRSGYVPRSARAAAVQMGAEVGTIEAAYSWVAREHLYAFAPRVSLPASADPFSCSAKGSGASSGYHSPPRPASPNLRPPGGSASSGTPTSGAAGDHRPATTMAPAFARPRPVDARTHPALTQRNELRFVAGTVDGLFIIDVPPGPDSYVLPLLKRAAAEKLTGAAHDRLCHALDATAAGANDVTTLLANQKLAAALGGPSAWDAAHMLDANKDAFIRLIGACFRFGERAVLQRAWAALCASPPTEPACHVLREVSGRHGAPAAPRRGAAAGGGGGTVAAATTKNAGDLSGDDSDDSASSMPPLDASDPDCIAIDGGGTLLRVFPAAKYPHCFTSDMFGAAVDGMARALRSTPDDRRPRLLKIFALVMRPLIRKAEPPLPLAAASVVSSLCLEHTDNKDCQGLYQSLRQALNADPAEASAASSAASLP